jgi:hypothetical protein
MAWPAPRGVSSPTAPVQVASTSAMATSMRSPSPLWRARKHAATVAMAAVMPAPRSPMGTVAGTGVPRRGARVPA